MCERFGWTEAEYNATSRQTIVEFSTILRTLDEMAEEEAKKAEQEKRKWPSR
jgi:hypothetical protein